MLDESPTSDEGSGSPNFSEACLRLPWPDWFPPVYVHSPYGFLNHNRYRYFKDQKVERAKAGGSNLAELQDAFGAAEDAMERYMRYDSLASIRSLLSGRLTYVVAPVKPSYPNGNVLASYFASTIARELELIRLKGIFQKPRRKRDKTKEFLPRFANPVEFYFDPERDAQNIVREGVDFILADDVLTYGGTFAGLRGFIENHGGRVICMTALAGMPDGFNRDLAKSLSPNQLARYDQSIFDHRSYERQGVDEIPTMHLGPTSTTMERKHKAEQERKGEPYKPRTFKAQENERRRSLNDHVREMVRELAETVRDVAEKAKSAKKRGIQALLRAVGAKRRDQEIERARQAAEARRREEERLMAKLEQERRAAKEKALKDAESRKVDMVRQVKRLSPDARERFLATEYPADPFERVVKGCDHPLGTAGLNAEEKVVRAELKVHQEQEKRQQAERMQALARGRGRGGPSRSRDCGSGPSFDLF